MVKAATKKSVRTTKTTKAAKTVKRSTKATKVVAAVTPEEEVLAALIDVATGVSEQPIEGVVESPEERLLRMLAEEQQHMLRDNEPIGRYFVYDLESEHKPIVPLVRVGQDELAIMGRNFPLRLEMMGQITGDKKQFLRIDAIRHVRR